MSDSAIQTDVPAVATNEVKEVPKTAREIAMEAIEARHQAEMVNDNGFDMDVDGNPIAEAAPAPVIAEPIDQLEAQLGQVATANADQGGKVKIKIDGVESEVPLDEVVRQYQKNSSADKRLAEATRLLREAQEAEAARLLASQQAQQQAQQQQLAAQQAVTETPNPASTVAESGKDFLKALFEGDEENALSALERVMEGRQPSPPASAPTLDIDQITNAVTQHVQQKLVVESALAQNRNDYPELYADPDMEALGLTKIQRMRQEEGVDFLVALDAVSKDMAAKFGWNKPTDGRQAAPATTTSPRAAKLEQKQRSIDNITSVNTKTTTTEQQPENPSDVIAAMKAARLGS